MHKKQNLLTKNEKYISLLRIIGNSSTALTKSEIKDKMIKSGVITKEQGPFVYQMIRDLRPDFIDPEEKFLFNWDRVTKDKGQQKNILNFLKNYKKIDWIDDYDDYIGNKSNNNNSILFVKNDDNEIIIKNLKNKPNTIIVITIVNKFYSNMKIISDNNEKEIIPLYRKDKSIYFSPFDFTIKKPLLHLINHFHNSVEYLNIELDFENQQKIQEYEKKIIQKDKERRKCAKDPVIPKFFSEGAVLSDKITEIKQDRGLWHYYLNTRGLILYIIGEIDLEEKDKKNYSKRINLVIENLSKSYINHFPFLFFYQEFRNQFKTVEKRNQKTVRNIEIEILKEIANTFRFHIQSIDILLLEYLVTKMYSYRIMYVILDYIKRDLLPENDQSLIKTLREYQLVMLEAMNKYLSNQKKGIENQYDLLFNTEIDDEIIRYTNFFIANSLKGK